jgi:hypothetical protein
LALPIELSSSKRFEKSDQGGPFVRVYLCQQADDFKQGLAVPFRRIPPLSVAAIAILNRSQERPEEHVAIVPRVVLNGLR